MWLYNGVQKMLAMASLLTEWTPYFSLLWHKSSFWNSLTPVIFKLQVEKWSQVLKVQTEESLLAEGKSLTPS